MTSDGAAHDGIDARAVEVVLGTRTGKTRVRGRVLPNDDGSFCIADATGRAPTRGIDASLAYAWVSATGIARDGVLEVSLVFAHTPPQPPQPDSDLARFAKRDGLLAEHVRLRARARTAVRAFFDERGYLEVETPTMVRNPGSDLHLDAFEVHGLRERRFLSTSPELQMKRLVSAGFDRIYQLRYAYRRDEIGSHHEPEFTMLEWYRAFANEDDLLADTEALISHVIHTTTGRSSISVGGRACSLTGPWPRRTIRELYRTFVDPAIDAFALADDDFFQLFAEQIQPALGHDTPVHVVDWPARFASLARVSPHDPSVAQRVETFIAGIELSNGFVELVDPVEQQRRFALDNASRVTHGKVTYAEDERFLRALSDGLPDTVGNALGFDRLVMLLAGASNIADVIAIPQDRA